MRKSFLFRLIILGITALAGAGGLYLVYTTSTKKIRATKIDINKSENSKKPKELKENVGISDDEKKSIRLGFWNVLNYTNRASKTNTAKTYALAKVINSAELDLVGLAEIMPSGDGSDIVKELEEINPNAGWKELTTEKQGKQNQQEKYTFLYKSSLLEIINFKDTSNPYLIQNGIKLQWARPLAAVKFQTKTKVKNDFTFAIGHFDAPGVKANRGEIRDLETSQGSQEAGEARDLINVLNEIDKKDGINNEIIFMADTNIRAENAEKLFEHTLNSYKSLLSKDEKTTLSGTFGLYANSYDKIFYKGDLAAKNAKKFDIFSIFQKKIVDINKYDNFRKKDGRSTNYKVGQLKEINRIKGVSDHTMIYFDLVLSEKDRD
ncbi:endonuclease/exonuclease/phosphatase family protein [Mesomycoplasma flocculare]|uniref:Membrane nuclease n=1 Tax=Mesomycoplasma flocculare ATCC 27399 TaxID=743971 RepID=A0A0A8E767_MESFC|nr:endonuclease/exonuclease/phosphatase family protein [Mesomycoplasma flocculare]AJC50050.1 membrane nuclease [Mesomycoplasma flocculare ATCC 27399]ENX51017.1 membrane nuclease, lipoprotein [Mesomycoplasma flocculare ATCC 27716]MXR23013.1 nuclease [Mesomycoplasma flocculare]